jgi:transposase
LEPLLPERPARRIGRPRVDDRVAFTAILFVLLTGLPWRLVPDEIGCSGVTAWRRLRDWQATDIWAQLHRELLRGGNATGQLDWSVGVVDGSHIRALRGGSLTGPSPVDRARTGSKHHLIVDLHGLPLSVELTGGNRNDVTQLLPLESRPLSLGSSGLRAEVAEAPGSSPRCESARPNSRALRGARLAFRWSWCGRARPSFPHRDLLHGWLTRRQPGCRTG